MKFRTLLAFATLALILATARAVEPQVFFSRSDPVAKILVREIDAAHKSIHLLIYALTDDGLADALVRASKRGVDVRIAMDRSQSEGNSSLADSLIEKLGKKNVVIRTGKGRGIMHEKMAIYDGLTVTLGSFNWTDSARDYNWENLIVLRDARMAETCEREFQRVWSSPEPKSDNKPEQKPKPKRR